MWTNCPRRAWRSASRASGSPAARRDGPAGVHPFGPLRAHPSGPSPDSGRSSRYSGTSAPTARTDPEVTDSAGTPAGAGDPAGRGDPVVPPRRRRWLRWTALGVSVLLLAVAGVSWWLYRKLDDNITTDITTAEELERYERERPHPAPHGAMNVLLIGSDTRAGAENRKYGRAQGQRSDTTILLHLAGDRRSTTAVSIPRDLLVDIPSCRTAQGARTPEAYTQFNVAYQYGGAACTIRTVEQLTGVRIDHHMVIDFHGFKDMVDAVDGVEVCLREPIDDKAAHLKLKAGRQTLDGEQALGFVRARKSLGNGSDTDRMGRQQQFLGALFNKVQSNGVLLNPTRLYPVLDAATRSITTDPGLASLKDLYDLTRSMRGVPPENVRFLTVPRKPYPPDPNRDELSEPKASALFERLRKDEPVAVARPDAAASTGTATERDENADGSGASDRRATPTFSGTDAASGMCG
ncbi:LCP family protein [Streptomyces sp. NPDC007861]|uniref:LCP family protein n=1 Tax=Streptomyces sp. NPDC007861 TaxID=3154893 RepID=UPI0033F4F6A6